MVSQRMRGGKSLFWMIIMKIIMDKKEIILKDFIPFLKNYRSFSEFLRIINSSRNLNITTEKQLVNFYIENDINALNLISFLGVSYRLRFLNDRWVAKYLDIINREIVGTFKNRLL